ncbi:MAG: helix-turn-helix domain-containing protein [Actinomycetota bacterium]|nr:helix-turn-helix domain-containing protein [Actinomycetota bacterium]
MLTVQRRAAVHAALGEVVRLAIVDRMVPGDASPGELAEQFGLPTNLLAHHLRVLEQAGVIRRVRSEGDRRRSYVQLCVEDPTVRAALTGGTSGLPTDIARVLFVCTANSARSQLAAAIWSEGSTVPATSAGTHPAARVHPRTVTVGQRHGLRLGRAATRHFDDVVSPTDLVVVVCDNAYEQIPASRTHLHWAVPDPARIDTEDAFDDAYQDITRRVEQLADSLTH